MRYSDELKDKDWEYYEELQAFHHHAEELETDLWISSREYILSFVPKSTLIDVSYTIDQHKLSVGVYICVLEAFISLQLIDKIGLYSKDKNRNIEQIKEKVDYMSRVSNEPLAVEISKTKSEIKAIFYAGCKDEHLSIDNKSGGIPDKIISQLFKDVFSSNKLHKGNLEEVKQSLRSNQEKFFNLQEYYMYALERNLPINSYITDIYFSNPYTEEEKKELEIRKELNIKKSLEELEELERKMEEERNEAIERHYGAKNRK